LVGNELAQAGPGRLVELTAKGRARFAALV
jgi:hypothetical protein